MGFKETLLGLATPKERAAQVIIEQTEGRGLSPKRQTERTQARGITRRLFLRRLGLGVGYLLAIGCSTASALKIFLERESQVGEFGKLKQNIPLIFTKDEKEVKMDVLIFETERPFVFDTQAFGETVNLFAVRDTTLPTYSRTIITDRRLDPNDPGRFGMTIPALDTVFLSIKDGFNDTSFLREYPKEAVLNGVLVGEIANLMLAESGNVPEGAGYVERLGDSTGFMASAIFAKRCYAQYRMDISRVVYPESGGLIVFDESTYREFQQKLQPTLTFH